MLKDNEQGFYIKIDKQLKRDFNIKCLENGVSMTEALRNIIKEYVNNKNVVD